MSQDPQRNSNNGVSASAGEPANQANRSVPGNGLDGLQANPYGYPNNQYSGRPHYTPYGNPPAGPNPQNHQPMRPNPYGIPNGVPHGGMTPGAGFGGNGYVPNESPISRLAASYGISLFVRRWSATAIDALLITGLALSLVLVPDYFKTLHVILLAVVVLSYYLFFEGWTGFTVGKLVMRIQVVNQEGRPPGFLKSLIRSSIRLFELNPLIFFGIPAAIAMLASRKNQRLGDMGANTFVVRSKDLTPGSRAKMVVVISTVSILSVFSLFSAAAGSVILLSMPAAGDTQYISKDGLFRVTAGSDWSEKSGLAEDADISLGNNSLGGKYFILFSESKDNFFEETTLDDYTYYVEDYYAYEMIDSPLYWPRSLKVNDYPAYQFAYESYEYGEGVTYVITTLETEGHFHQLIVWTTSARYERIKDELFKILESFTEVNRRYVL